MTNHMEISREIVKSMNTHVQTTYRDYLPCPSANKTLLQALLPKSQAKNYKNPMKPIQKLTQKCNQATHFEMVATS